MGQHVQSRSVRVHVLSQVRHAYRLTGYSDSHRLTMHRHQGLTKQVHHQSEISISMIHLDNLTQKGFNF